MVKIFVSEPFNLTSNDNSTKFFGIGEHEVDEATALHWYVILHAKIADDALEAKAQELRELYKSRNDSGNSALGRVCETLSEVQITSVPGLQPDVPLVA